MKKLFLFDIDHTLVKGNKNHRFKHGLKNLHGIEADMERDIGGMTDFLIFEMLLREEGWSDEQIKKHVPELLVEAERVYMESFEKGSVRLLPGVKDLLEAVQAKGILIGLITGNIESIAHHKLQDAGIDDFFSFGGFGSDPHSSRAEIVEVAIAKAGYQKHKDLIYVFGDTPRDIVAAHEAGVVNSVGVSNGFLETSELVVAGAKFVFEDFRNTKDVLAKLQV